MFLDCCERDFAQCEAHPDCRHLEGDCCPTQSGVFLDCCLDDQSDDDLTYESDPTAGSGSNFTACEGLDGNCCPTDSGVFLACCGNTQDSCEDHPKCAALNLTGACCPTIDDVYLDCCEKEWSLATHHAECVLGGKEGDICPYPDGTFDDCCVMDLLARSYSYLEVSDTKSPTKSAAIRAEDVSLVMATMMLVMSPAFHIV